MLNKIHLAMVRALNLVCLTSGVGILLQGPVGFNQVYMVWKESEIFKTSKEASENPDILGKAGNMGKPRG